MCADVERALAKLGWTLNGVGEIDWNPTSSSELAFGGGETQLQEREGRVGWSPTISLELAL